MREKGHQNWPLVIRPRYDPHLPFSGRSVSKPWSKRDTSSSIPPFQEMSVPHCPTAITSCEPGSPQTKACLFLPTSGSAEKEIQHIFMRLSGISCFIIMKERIVSASKTWNMWHQEMVWCCYSLVCEEECIFLARGIRDDAIQRTGWTVWNQRGRKGNMLFGELTKDAIYISYNAYPTNKSNNGINFSMFWMS